MANNFESFNNIEGEMRKTSVVQERTAAVAAHMYKQFLDFQKSTQNTAEIFIRMTDMMKIVVESLKQSFNMRNISADNIYCKVDSTKTIATINILWHTISFTSRFNTAPKALPRDVHSPLFCGRIFALKGDYVNIMQDTNNYDSQIKALLENEIASLYVPAEKNQGAIMTIRHKDNQEYLLSHADSPRDFLLKVIEIVCAGGEFHEQTPKPNFFF